MSFSCNLLDENEISDEILLKLYDFFSEKNDYVLLKKAIINGELKYLVSEKISNTKVKTKWLTERELLYRRGPGSIKLIDSLDEIKIRNQKSIHIIKKDEDFVFSNKSCKLKIVYND